MTLAPGTQLGPYAVRSLIGSGGMGQVYRAHDSRLGRDVAIKVAAEAFSERFTREARAIAALNHPNICHLYDVGPNYLVMELVEGESPRGPLAFEEALPILRQLIDGIEAAHDKGIIHRDLKTANIKVTPDGVVKILDFGLARLSGPAAGHDVQQDVAESPTLSFEATQAGVILGTAGYMAPEQAKGKQADRRSDIWSFGVVAYELLTGRRLFQGETTVEILGAVLNKDLDLSAAPPRTQRLLRWCLERDRKDRLQAIGDARRLLSEEPVVATQATVAPALLGRALSVLPWAVTFALAAAWLASAWRTPPPDARPALRFPISLGERAVINSNVSFALSPDGTQLLIRARGDDGRVRLTVRPLDGATPRTLEGTEDGAYPSFSADGQWVAFVSEGKLNKVSVQGGAPVALCDVMNPRGTSWDADGSIVVAADRLGGLSRCPAAGGALEPLSQLGPGEDSHRWPQALPEAGAVVFTSSTSPDPDTHSIMVQSLASGQRKTLWKGGTYGRYLPSGHLVFVSQRTLFAAVMDLERLELVGAPRPILKGVAIQPGSDSALFDVSPAGTLVLATEYPLSRNSIVRLDAAGGMGPLVPVEGGRSFRFSPDGRRGAFEVVTGGLWIHDLERESQSRLTANGRQPVWSRNGQDILFTTRDARRDGISVVRADGSGSVVSLLEQRGALGSLSVSPDGTLVAFAETESGNSDIWTLPIDLTGDTPRRTGEPQAYLRTPAVEREPRFSPDGRWLAYESDESGRPEAYVRPYPGPGARFQISTDGVQNGLLWSPDGKDIVYRNVQGRLMAVAYTASGSTFPAGRPRQVSSVAVEGFLEDMAPDGKSFAVIATGGIDPRPVEVTFVVNFFDELRRMVPVTAR